MKANVAFTYCADEIFSLVDAETSRLGAFLRFPDGGSAYDTLKIHEKDKPVIYGLISDSFRTIQTRFTGECEYYMNCKSHNLELYLPDFDVELFDSASDEVRRYIVLSVTARWLMARSFGEYAKMVAADSEASMNRLVDMLRTRKYPIE